MLCVILLGGKKGVENAAPRVSPFWPLGGDIVLRQLG